MASNARNLSKLLGTSTQVPTTALPTAIADLETVGQTLSDGEIAPSSIKSNTLTQSFDSNQAVTFNMADSIDAVSPILSVFKEVPQAGFSSKGQWDVNANATNYEFFDEKSISYSSANLTPSATGDGTFTNSAANTTYYDVANATYDSVSNAQYTQANGVYSTIFNNNGTKAYVTAHNSSGDIYQYSLSTAYDVSTNTYDNKTYSFSQFTYPTASRFNGDGTKLYTVAWNGSASSSRIWQYSLSTAYDISTASYDSVNLNLTAHNFAWGFTFNNDGSKVFVSIVDGGATGGRIAEYSLSTNYDLSTAGSQTLYVLSGTGWANYGIEFNNDGTKLFVNNNDDAPTKGPHIFTLSTAYDISTVSYTSTNADVNTLFGGTTGAADITFNNNGSKMYISDSFNGYVRQFSVSTSTAFNEADVGKKVVGNSGSAIITAISGTYQSVTAFADTSAISSWQLFGAQGKSDGSGIELSGFSSSYGTIYGKNLSDVVNHTTDAFNSVSFLIDFVISEDGTKLFYTQHNDGKIYERAISTAWDLSTISSTDTISGGHYLSNAPSTRINGFTWSTDGMKLYCVYDNSSTMAEFYNDPNYPQYAFRVDTLTYSGSSKTLNTNLSSGNSGVIFKNDGTMVYITNGVTPSVYSWPLSTAWDLSTAGTRVQSNINFSSNNLQCLALSADGTSMIVENETNDNLQHFTLSTPFDITTMTETSQTHHINTVITGTTGAPYNITANNPNSIQWADNGNRFFVYTTSNGASLTSANQKAIYQFSTGSATHPYSTYSPALTNSSNGQINSSSWLDINSMTADETKNDGDIFYAVSTDNRTSWAVAKASDGVRKIARNNSGTWQYNNDGGAPSYYDFSNPTAGATSTFTSPNWHVLAFSTDGTKLISLDSGYLKLKLYNLSTAWDISTISSSANAESSISTGNLYGATISADGTKLIGYVNANGYVYEYTMSTPFDVTTLTADGNTNSLGGASTSNAFNWFIKPGTYDTVYAVINRHLYKYTFTGGSITTGTVTRDANFLDLDPGNQKSYINNGQLQFKPDGTEFYIGQATDSIIEKWTLSTAWDITTATKSSETVTSVDARSIWLKPNGEKIYYIDQSDSKKIKEINIGGSEYGTNETWVSGTNNNEHATLQEALGAQSFNRMNKAQLDAVADNYHFSQDSADTLDLMIAPYAASGTSPISDGVTINYDAEALIREAIPGTDYIAEFPNQTTLNITAVGAANLKIRAQ